MTKKDYIIITNCLKELADEEKVDQTTLHRVVCALIEVMAKDNKRFDAMKFKFAIYE